MGKGPTRQELDAAYGKTIPDHLGPGLSVVFVGINPSLYSAATGRHFARPGNRFWPTLHRAGFTPHQLRPEQDHELPRHGAGLTNVVARATARADELDAEELRRGGKILVDKLAAAPPRFVAFVGIGAYRTAFGRRDAKVGRQTETLDGIGVWVLPNPSGLNAHYQLPDLVRLYRQLHRATTD